MPSTPESILKSVFGYDQFRPLQREIIDNVLARRDTLAILPTGGGKSLCYQIRPDLRAGCGLAADRLMKDQVERLQALGAPAVF
jgi:ATP-dependent DNA helicase RecQ